MMKKDKNVVTKRLSCLIIISMLFFIGCGEKAKTGNSKAENEKNVKIGAILPLTGGGAFIGKSIQEGLLLAKEQYGENLELIIEDSQGIPKNALSIYKLLKTQKASKGTLLLRVVLLGGEGGIRTLEGVAPLPV